LRLGLSFASHHFSPAPDELEERISAKIIAYALSFDRHQSRYRSTELRGLRCVRGETASSSAAWHRHDGIFEFSQQLNA
jgi:hypothetical protein